MWSWVITGDNVVTRGRLLDGVLQSNKFKIWEKMRHFKIPGWQGPIGFNHIVMKIILMTSNQIKIFLLPQSISIKIKTQLLNFSLLFYYFLNLQTERIRKNMLSIHKVVLLPRYIRNENGCRIKSQKKR